MVNYQDGKIYTIRSHQTEKVYVGSTCSPLSKRFYDHKAAYKYWQNGGKKYTSSYEIVGLDDCYIELHEAFPCQSRDELKRKEGIVIRSLECVNKVIAGRTYGERWIDNGEKYRMQRATYRAQNKDQLAAHNKIYYAKNKEVMNMKGAEYYQKNHEKALADAKAYRDNPNKKEKIAEYKREWKRRKKLEKG